MDSNYKAYLVMLSRMTEKQRGCVNHQLVWLMLIHPAADHEGFVALLRQAARIAARIYPNG